MKSYCYENKNLFKILLFVFVLSLSSNLAICGKAAEWCWTKSMVNEPSFILNKKNGGMNWSFCMEEKKKPPVKYKAIVTTSSLPDSATNSVIKIQIFGEKGKAEETDLSISGFEKGAAKMVSFQSKEVGDIQKIRLRLDGKQYFRCKDVLILKGAKRFMFQCMRYMGPCTNTEPTKCTLDMDVDGNKGFEVTIKTGNIPEDGTSSPIFIQLLGDKGKGQKKIFSETGLKVGSTITKTIYTNEIGKPIGFTTSLETKGKWKPELVSIKSLTDSKITEFKLDNTLIINPGNSPYTYDSTSKSKDTKKEEAAKKGGDEGSGETPDSMDENNTDGGLMTPEEKKEMIDLKCEQPMINPDPETNFFGPDYPTKDVSYSKVLVRCPSDCWKIANTNVYGMGIHPEKSPICMSAIVDKAMSVYGGIFAISIYPALDKYKLPHGTPAQINGINIKPFLGSAKKSYVLAKVDNVDLVEKDIRILDHRGQLSNEGRVEMRYEGVWGTICSLGNNRQSAKRICKDVGYKDGEWKSPNDQSGKNFCMRYHDENHCGAMASKVLFSKITCEPVDMNFNKCNKFLADPDECSHQYDAIIRCYDNNFASAVDIPDKTVRMELSKKEGVKVTGRLELFYAQKWAAICNIGFTKKSAEIACKTLGFTEGDVVSKKEDMEPFMQKDKTKGFNADHLTCKGTEDKIAGCKVNLHDVNCKHDQDVVITCHGNKGDVTGKSQYDLKTPIPDPKLGKLPIPKRTISCKDKGWETVYRGDPGSTYIITCPSDCDVQKGSIWGTGVFTSDTYICRSAIHAGVISAEGGEFLFVKTFGQRFYTGRMMNSIRSTTSHKSWPSSFTLFQMTKVWSNHANLLHGSFIDVGSDVVLLNQSESKINLSNHLLRKSPDYFVTPSHSSFLEMYQGPPIPIFQWIPPSYTYAFEKDTSILIDKHKMDATSDYTIIFKFILNELSQEYGETFLFSYSGCGGFNVIINKRGNIAVGDYCDKTKFYNPGYIVPLNDYVSVYIRYVSTKLTIKIKSDKVKTEFHKVKTISLDIKEAKDIGIGRRASEDGGWFMGSMKFLQIYQGGVPESTIGEVNKNVNPKNVDAVAVLRKTVDDRLCVSRCSINPTPPNPGCGDPPKEADINGTSTVEGPDIKPKNGSDANGEPKKGEGEEKEKKKDKEKKKKDKDGKKKEKDGSANTQAAVATAEATKPGGTGTYNKKKVNALETNKLDCDANLNDPRFVGLPGKIFKAHCPNCSTISKAMVYGTVIYHPRSSICKAAQHQGILKAGHGGNINIKIIVGKEIYNGSEGEDKSMSATFAKAEKSFTIEKAVKSIKVTCQTTANKGKYAMAAIGDSFVVQCPSNCSKEGDKIWGTEVYTDTSPICIAAAHRGITNDKGGEAKFVISKGLSNYKGSNGFGITSLDFGPHVKSIEFLGLRAGLHKTYVEKYEGILNEKWLQENHPLPIDAKTNNWSYFSNPDHVNKDGIKEPLIGIRHTGTISTNAEYEFGSWISLKNTEFANGTVKFNFNLSHDKPIAFFFRYTDNNNLYGIRFDPRLTAGNVHLFKFVEGARKMVAVQSNPFQVGKWYRVTVNFNFDKVQVAIQSGTVRQHKILFNLKMHGLHRGSIGFGTKGNKDFLINGISIGETTTYFDSEDDSNQFTWKSVLSQTKTALRRHYCFDLFLDDKINQQRCMRPHIYCKYKCDEIIPHTMNILNYNCYGDCIRECKLEDIGPVNKEAEPPKKINFMVWQPSLEEKCDYKPSGETTFVPAKVKELNIIEKRKFAMVEYKTADGDNRMVNVEYPNPDLMKCGQGLTIRKDCK